MELNPTVNKVLVYNVQLLGKLILRTWRRETFFGLIIVSIVQKFNSKFIERTSKWSFLVSHWLNLYGSQVNCLKIVSFIDRIVFMTKNNQSWISLSNRSPGTPWSPHIFSSCLYKRDTLCTTISLIVLIWLPLILSITSFCSGVCTGSVFWWYWLIIASLKWPASTRLPSKIENMAKNNISKVPVWPVWLV